MAGYTPAFDTMLTGTLYGKWPHNGIWALLLTRVDRHGHIDETPECIAAHIGIPVKKLMASIEYFMTPDPASRTKDNDGRRLEPLDPSRSWGWHVVNHGQYREKARLMTKNAREVEEGKNAERKRKEHETADDRRSPPLAAGDRPSESESESESESYTDTGVGGADAPATLAGEKGRAEQSPEPRARARVAHRLPEDFALTDERRAIAVTERVDPDRTFAKFSDYWRAASGRTARKLDWDATWRNWCRNDADRGGRANQVTGRRKSSDELEAEERARASN